MRIAGQRRWIAVLTVATLLLLTTAAMADTVSFGSNSPLTIANAPGGATFDFGSATVTGATPITDSLNHFSNIPFTIENGIIWNGQDFSPSTTTVHIGTANADGDGDSGIGYFTGNINFITITNSAPGTFAISISLTEVSYSCIGKPSQGGCVISGVLSKFALAGQGYLNFSFSMDGGPQNLDDLRLVASTPGASYSSNGFSGSIDTNPSVLTNSQSETTVPEPASLALFGSGLLAGGSFVRRKLAN